LAAGKFARAAAELIRILGEERSAIAGGMAVNAHGFVRGTRDVDVIVAMPLADARAALVAAGISARLFRGDVIEGDIPCVRGVIATGRRPADAVAFDVLPALVPLRPESFVELDVHGQRLRVVDADTLLRLKLKARSPRDLYDVAILCGLHPGWKDRALRLALAEGEEVSERLLALRRDPRVRAQVRDAQRHARALREFTRRRSSREDRRPRRREK
jgi:hypothetical protein